MATIAEYEKEARERLQSANNYYNKFAEQAEKMLQPIIEELDPKLTCVLYSLKKPDLHEQECPAAYFKISKRVRFFGRDSFKKIATVIVSRDPVLDRDILQFLDPNNEAQVTMRQPIYESLNDKRLSESVKRSLGVFKANGSLDFMLK